MREGRRTLGHRMSAGEVKTLNEAFAHCPACGQRRTEVQEPLVCECGFLYYFNPASAVGGLITDREGKMLFIRRERDPGRGKLGLPGGFIDAGETVEEALDREVAEEVGLTVARWRYLASYPNHYPYRGVLYQVTDVFFTGEVETFSEIQSDASEVREWFLAPAETVRSEDFAFASNARAVADFAKSL